MSRNLAGVVPARTSTANPGTAAVAVPVHDKQPLPIQPAPEKQNPGSPGVL